MLDRVAGVAKPEVLLIHKKDPKIIVHEGKPIDVGDGHKVAVDAVLGAKAITVHGGLVGTDGDGCNVEITTAAKTLGSCNLRAIAVSARA